MARRGRWRVAGGSWVAALVAAGALVPAAAGQAQTPSPAGQAMPAGGQAQGVSAVGFTDLGGEGLNGEVTVVGTTAVVAAGYVPQTTALTNFNNLVASLNVAPPCVTETNRVSVKVVDIATPSAPRVASTIALAPGQAALDVDALHVSTPAFTGDLLAVALATCRRSDEAFAFGVSGPGSFADRGVAYYDISDPAKPRLLGRYLADSDDPDPEAPACGPPPARSESRCAKDVGSVELKRIRDGRIISVVSRFDGLRSNQVSGVVRLVDVTDPTRPTQLGTWPKLGEGLEPRPAGLAAAERAGESNNGCYPRDGGRAARFSADGTKVLVPYLDGGLFTLDVADLAQPKVLGRWGYSDDWLVEGQAAYVTETQVGGRTLSLLADEDWWWQTTALRIDSPASLAGLKLGCSDLYTTNDQTYRPQIHRKPGGQIAGEVVFAGRACPARALADGTPVAPDPVIGNPAGKIVLTDNVPLAARQPGINVGSGCGGALETKRVEDLGGLARVRLYNILAPEAIAFFNGNFFFNGEMDIPGVVIKRGDGDALRAAICPTVVDRQCVGGQRVMGTLLDLPGEWGGLRVLDTTDPTRPTELAVWRPDVARVMPPPDHRGIYAVHHTVAEGSRAYAAWNTAGLRVLDLANPAAPVEVASFVPPDRADPTGTVPAKTFVVGVATTARHVVVSDMNSGLWVLTKPAATPGEGYWLAAADGGVFAVGNAPFLGSAGGLRLRSPIVSMAPTPSGKGYWLAAADGGVFAFGDARFAGSTGGRKLNAPVVGLAPTPTGQGYWLVAQDGGVFAFGDARFFGSTGGTRLNQPIVTMAATPGGRGYQLFAADGGVFAFGDAPFRGSAGGTKLAAPIVGAAPTNSGRGYQLVAADGGVFSFGDATFAGSTAGRRLAAPVVAIAGSPGSPGYWLLGRDGGVYAFGAAFAGSLGGSRLNAPMVAMASPPR